MKSIKIYSPIESDEYADFYKGYIARYEGVSIHEAFRLNREEMQRLFATLDDNIGAYTYSEGKWTVKEVILHCTDAERIFSYRALRFIRSDDTPLTGFDHDRYVLHSDANSRSIGSLYKEWKAVRKSTLALFKMAADDGLKKTGTANGFNVSVRALAYIIAGHCAHHLDILKSKYGIKM